MSMIVRKSVSPRRPLTVGNLMVFLQGLPKDALVVAPASDHSYSKAAVEFSTALDDGDGGLTEDFGEEITPESEHGKRITILLIA
jgi:hypothetical protein